MAIQEYSNYKEWELAAFYMGAEIRSELPQQDWGMDVGDCETTHEALVGTPASSDVVGYFSTYMEEEDKRGAHLVTMGILGTAKEYDSVMMADWVKEQEALGIAT